MVPSATSPGVVVTLFCLIRERLKLHTSSNKEKDTSIKDSLLKDTDAPPESDLKQVIVEPSTHAKPTVPQAEDKSDAPPVPPRVRNEPPEVTDKPTDASESPKANDDVSSERSVLSSESSIDKAQHWVKLKKAAISKDVGDQTENGEEEAEVEERPKANGKSKQKPNLILTRKTKHYR